MVKIRSLACLCVCVWLWACGDDEPPKDAGQDRDAGHDAGEDSGVRSIDRSGLTDIGAGGRLDYAKPEHWVCRPDIDPSECTRNLDATEIAPDGALTVEKHVPATEPDFDCFYVYPTVWLNSTPQMTDFSDTGVKLVLDPLLSQGARFNGICRMYAPMYRQAGLAGVALVTGADKQIALQDVRDAFAYYLEHDNQGRNFVLLGHSQGAFMLSSLISRDIDDDAALRERMISAVLLGGQVYAPPGEKVGGSFKNVPRCTQKGETGCVIAYNMFAKEAPPSATAPLGRVETTLANEEVDTSGQVLCVDPATLRDGGDRYLGSYFALMLNNPSFGTPKPIPGVDTRFVVYRDMFKGECVVKDGHSYLEITLDQPAGDTREVPAYRNTLLEAVGFGLHLVDYNIALEDLIEIVKLQAAAM